MIFTPRPYQDIIANAGLETRRLNIFASVGVGKTGASYMLFDKLRMLGHARRALVLGPKRVALSAWPAERTKWLDSFGHLRVAVAIGTPQERLQALLSDSDIVTMNYDNIEWLIDACNGRLPFDTVIADECFVAGTPVKTSFGNVPIENITPGMLVHSAHGPKKVVRVYRKQSTDLVRLRFSDGRTLVCTRTHPIWTDDGWTDAGDTAGKTCVHHSDMRAVREAIWSEGFKKERRVEPGEILLPFLFDKKLDSKEACRVVQRTARPEPTPVAGRERVVQQRSPDAREHSGEIVGDRESPGGRIRLLPRWERLGDDQVRTIVGFGIAPGLGVESSDTNEVPKLAWHTDLIQAGFCMAGDNGLSGSGWCEPSDQTRKRARQQENSRTGGIRVDCVEVVERGRLQDVWDIEVEDSHTYFANDVLVHNCTRLKNHRISLQTSTLGNEFMRGQGSKRAGALAKLAFGGEVVNWYNLTGTPAPNGLQDLWGQMFFIDRGKRLGHSFTAFEQRWFRVIKNADQVAIRSEPHPWAEQQIKDLIRDVSITIDARDWFPIEEPIERHIEVDLPPKARKAYREMAKEMFTALLEHDVEALNGGGKVGKCRQIASGAVFYDHEGRWQHVHDEKLEALRSLVSETNGENLLVAYQFTPERDAILKAFPKARFLDSNPQTLVDWNAGKIPMLVCHPASAGHGLSLQDGGRILVDYSTGWDLELDEQVLGRIGPTRQLQSGYKRSVFRYRIVARDTVEDLVVIPRLKTKASVQDSLLAAMKRLA